MSSCKIPYLENDLQSTEIVPNMLEGPWLNRPLRPLRPAALRMLLRAEPTVSSSIYDLPDGPVLACAVTSRRSGPVRCSPA